MADAMTGVDWLQARSNRADVLPATPSQGWQIFCAVVAGLIADGVLMGLVGNHRMQTYESESIG